MGTKSFVQIEINAVFTTTSCKMQFRSGVFDHFKGFFNSFVYLDVYKPEYVGPAIIHLKNVFNLNKGFENI
jgi:hypothetical protein